MKKLFMTVALLLPLWGAAQGIVFETGTFAQTIAKAKAGQKLIFVDFYTDWCAPCKQMTMNVFTQAAVGDLFNRSFVNAKVNAEKGEGIELARKAGVQAYPTMMFLNPENGRTVHSILGYRDVDQLLDEVRQLEQSGKYGGLEQMREDFADGKADLAFLVDYFKLLPREDERRSLVAARWLQSVPFDVFASEDATRITLAGDIIGALRTWDEAAMRRALSLVRQKLGDGRFFSGDYNIGVVFPLELAVGRIIEGAIVRGDSALLEQVFEWKTDYTAAVHRGLDGDPFIMSGRGIFFASAEMIRIDLMARNRRMIASGDGAAAVSGFSASEFTSSMESYMTSLMKRYPVDSVAVSRAGYFPWQENMLLSPTQAPGMIGAAAWASDDAQEIITRATDLYWRLMPGDKRVRERVARWLNYVCALNPYSAKAASAAAPLLVRVGHAKDAVANLRTVMVAYERVGLRPPLLLDLITDIENGKI